MIASGNQNQFPSSFAPLGDHFKALMFLSNLNGFNSSPSLSDQRFTQIKGSSKVWKEKGSKWSSHSLSLSLSLSLSIFMYYLCVLLSCFWVNLVLWYVLFNMFLFVCFQFCFILFFNKKKFKNKKNTKTMYVLCTLVPVYLGWPLKQNFINFVFFVT